MSRPISASLAVLGLVAGGLGAGVAFAGGDTAPTVAPAAAQAGPESAFVPIAPYRTLDTRVDGDPIDADDNEANKVRLDDPVSENPLPVPVRFAVDQDGSQIPDNATAVTYNVTVTETEGAGFVQIDTSPGEPGATSTVNWTDAGETIANSGVVLLGVAFDDDGFITAYVGGSDDAAAHVVIDITGYFTPLNAG